MLLLFLRFLDFFGSFFLVLYCLYDQYFQEREFELKKFLGDYVRTDGSPLERLTYYCIKALDVKNGRSLMPPPYYSNQNKKKVYFSFSCSLGPIQP